MLALLVPAFLLVVLGGLFAASEAAISSLSRADIQEASRSRRAHGGRCSPSRPTRAPTSTR
ncbi:hypothetical protein [Clavibacter tessellarius]|uniref:hypothetical protein n=1 Tax=Clavibacter tessellarius TaxID=31965 RepID=UPI0032433677